MSRKRQLVAIMFTDIVGYTALMQQDESRAIQHRNKHREIFNSITAQHEGKILQYYGDGTLSIFDSAIAAVRCGIDMQRAFQKDPSIPVRIGIHTGDIIFSDEEIIGDGVNVAARIESLAVAGSVFISEKVYDEIKNQASIHTTFIKSFSLKNVQKPIQVYAISNEGLQVPNVNEIRGKTEPATNHKISPKSTKFKKNKIYGSILLVVVGLIIVISYLKIGPESSHEIDESNQSIAVLAFENMSGDSEQEYFSDGISEEILNALTQVEGLKVAGRTSSFSFKGKDEDIRSIGKNLGVKMVLEGSVRKVGEKIRITAQLINVEDGFHLWSEVYDRKMEDVFAIQDDIAGRIVEKLKLQEQQSDEGKSIINVAAYDLLLKGQYFLYKDFEGTQQAMDYFQKALELDSNYAEVWALIGDTYTDYASYGILSNADAYSRARTAAQNALKINNQLPRAHKVMAYVYLYYDWDWEGALYAYEQAINYGMDDPDHFISFYDIFVNEDYEHAIHVCQQILNRDPLEVQHHWHLGFCHYLAGRFEEALTSFDNALELNPHYSEGYRWKGNTLSEMGEHSKAVASIEKALEISHGEGPATLDLLRAKINMGEEAEVIKILNQVINSGPVDPMGPAILYAMLGNKDETLKWLDKSYRERSLWIISLKVLDVWDPYRDDPGFQEIYSKMNFPD